MVVSNDDTIIEDRPSSGPISGISQARARRLERRTRAQHNDIPNSPKPASTSSKELEETESTAINHAFISKIRQNDTLARFKRESPSPSSSISADGNFDA